MEAESRGLRVPQDLAVIGFGDLDLAASNRPAITTVSVDRHAIGEQAATAGKRYPLSPGVLRHNALI